MFGSTKKERGGDENGTKNILHLFGSQIKKELNENGTQNMVDLMGKNFHPKCGMKIRCKGHKLHSSKTTPGKFLLTPVR